MARSTHARAPPNASAASSTSPASTISPKRLREQFGARIVEHEVGEATRAIERTDHFRARSVTPLHEGQAATGHSDHKQVGYFTVEHE